MESSSEQQMWEAYPLPETLRNWYDLRQYFEAITRAEDIDEIIRNIELIISSMRGKPVEALGLKTFAKFQKKYLERCNIDLKKLIKQLAVVALDREKYFPDQNEIYLLKKMSAGQITLRQDQVLYLLAHMFFCTTSEIQGKEMNSNCFVYWIMRDDQLLQEKLKFLFVYFKNSLLEIEKWELEKEKHHSDRQAEQIIDVEIENQQQQVDIDLKKDHRDKVEEQAQNEEAKENVTESKGTQSTVLRNISYIRITYDDKEYDKLDKLFKESELPLTNVEIVSDRLIESYRGPESIMIDFANEFIGGGAAEFGNVQEEILFLIFPELFVSQLLFEKMEISEAIAIKGCKQYAQYVGYGFNLLFVGENLKTYSDFDSKLRIETTFVAIDAIPFFNQGIDIQITPLYFNRELYKSFIGFQGVQGPQEEQNAFENLEMTGGLRKKIVTGKWGCGVFNGCPMVKFLLQLIAASQNQRDMVFTCFKDVECSKHLRKYAEVFKGCKVKEMMVAIEHVQKQNANNVKIGMDFIELLIQNLQAERDKKNITN